MITLINPTNPPVRVKWGRESTDEMGSVTLSGVAADSDDATRLTQSTKANKARIFSQLGRELNGSGVLERLPEIVKGLDKNADGLLQESELPQRMRGALLMRLDDDGNKALDSSELEHLRDWLQNLKAGRGA